MDFKRMQELEDIRVSEAQNTDPIAKKVKRVPFNEAKWHEEMQEKVEEYERINGKQLYNPNR
jgi:hypothetical protein